MKKNWEANKKIIIFAVLLICMVVPLVSATNYYNYVYNGTMWVPMLATADGQKKVWIEMKNCSYGNVQENLVVAKNFSVDSSDFFIDSNMGYVGIGTNVPQNSLNVIGDVNATGNVTFGQKITFALGEMIDNIVDGFVRITGGLNVVNSTGDSKFFINVTSGNVGVGTTGPSYKLDVNGAISGFGVVPIGSIVAWHKSFTNTPALPTGWVECNGQVLSDADSVYNGQTIPNLNGDGRFLRGNSTSGTLQAEDFKSHTHTIRSDRVKVDYEDPSTDRVAGTSSNWNTANAVTSSAGGAETRPINMAVVWIMRVK